MMGSDFGAFEAAYGDGKTQLVWRKLAADLENPISASLKLIGDETQPFFLLESVEAGGQRGRYSMIALDPDAMWKCNDQQAYLSEGGAEFQPQSLDPLASLRAFHAASQCDIDSQLPPMASGLIGYLSYDAIRFTESTVPDTNPDKLAIPVGVFMRPRVMVVFDEVTDSIFLICRVVGRADQTAKQCYQAAKDRLQQLVDQLHEEDTSQQCSDVSDSHSVAFESNMTQAEYEAMVEKAKSYIYAGDVFQVVPSQRFRSDFPYSPFAFYRSLRHLNPSPFLFYLNLGDFQLVGSSPEIMVRLRDNKVTIRPLAGTRRRGKTPEEDAALAKDLLADDKEIAEHLMLIDLSRNDVGRVTKPGSVKVSEQMVIEYYSHVMHISSNVEGELDDARYDMFDALFSGLPVGTVSGAPKIRAMQIIDELEKEKRSFYAGCVGYFSADGSMDSCITLRTALIKDGQMIVQAGGGVVADSNPTAEYQESCNKAKALMKAAEGIKSFIR